MSIDLWGYGVRTAGYKLFDPRTDPYYFDGLNYDPSGDDENIHSDLVTSWVIGNGMARRKPHIQRGVEQGPAHPNAPLTDTERWMQNMGHEFAKRIHAAPPTEGYTYRGMTVSPDWIANARRKKSVTLPLSSIDYDHDYSSSYTSPRVTRRPGVGVLMRIEPGAKAYPLAESEHITHGDFDVHDMHYATPEESDQYGIDPHTTVMYVRQRSVPTPVGSIGPGERTAMPAIDAYDDGYLDDNDPDSGPMWPMEERYTHQDIQPGPYYHVSPQHFEPGHILVPQNHLDKSQQGALPNHNNWVWMTRHLDGSWPWIKPDSNFYEIEPLDEGPWEWDKSDDYPDKDGPRYVSPRARVIRKISPKLCDTCGLQDPEHQPWCSAPSAFHTAARTAMPAPMPEGITFHYHSEDDGLPDWINHPEMEIEAPAVEARHNGNPIGYLAWDYDRFPSPTMMDVHPDYRRHGIGTALWDFARQHEPDLQHSEHLTDLGEQWVRHEQSRTASHDDYVTDEWRRWQGGGCLEYAHALQQRFPHLRGGTLYNENGPQHHFAHDDDYAYDSAGRHPMPYHGIDNDLEPDFNDDLNYYDAPDPDEIAAAHRHIERHGIGPHTAHRTAMPTYYHHTDNPDFRLDPSFVPENFAEDDEDYGTCPHCGSEVDEDDPANWNSDDCPECGGSLNRSKPGVFVSDDPHRWRSPYGEERGYVVDFDAPDLGDLPGVEPVKDSSDNAYFVPADQFHHLTLRQVRPRTAMPWYHVSPHDLPDGETLVPRGSPSPFEESLYADPDNEWRGDATWITDSPENARRWQKMLYNETGTYPEHLYEVEPERRPEPQVYGDFYNAPPEYSVPSARIIRKIKPKEARTMTAAVTVYTKPSCPQCDMTKKLLDRLGVEHSIVDVTADPEAHAYVTGLGYQQAPVVVVGDGEDHWGGFKVDRLKGLIGE